MTKSKTKQGQPEICMNCKYATVPGSFHPLSTEIKCTITDKIHNWEYSCKKWRIQE